MCANKDVSTESRLLGVQGLQTQPRGSVRLMAGLTLLEPPVAAAVRCLAMIARSAPLV